MAFNKRTWKGRQGTGLNKFSIDGATPVTVINQPDSVTEQGDALSAGNLNDLEDRIYDAFDDIADGTQIVGKATSDALGNVIDQTYETKADASDLKSAIDANSKRITNLETKAGDEIPVTYPSATYGMDGVPASVAPYGKVRELIMNSRVHNQLFGDNKRGITTNDVVISWDNGTQRYNISGTATGGGKYWLDIVSNPTRHCYLAFSDNPSIKVYIENSISANAVVYTPSATWGGHYGINIESGVTYSGSFHLYITDLNVYFNTTDLSFLGATDSAKLATIQSDYPELLIPSDYDTETRVDTTYSVVKSVGRNLLDPSTLRQGDYNNTSGLRVSTNVEDRPYINAGTYTISQKTAGVLRLWLMISDANNVLLETPVVNVTTKYATATFTQGGYLTVIFGNAGNTVITPAEVVAQEVMVLKGSADATYAPYRDPITISLPTPVTGKSAGSVHQIYYPETGEMTEPLGSVKPTASNTTFDSTNTTRSAFKVELPNMAPYTDNDDVPNIFMAGKLPVSNNTTSSPYVLWCRTTDMTHVIIGADPSVTDVAGFLALYGNSDIYYELATPNPNSQATDPMPNPFIKVEGGGTIRPVQTQTTQIDSAMSADYLGV